MLHKFSDDVCAVYASVPACYYARSERRCLLPGKPEYRNGGITDEGIR